MREHGSSHRTHILARGFVAAIFRGPITMAAACGAPIAALQFECTRVLSRFKRIICASTTQHDYGQVECDYKLLRPY